MLSGKQWEREMPSMKAQVLHLEPGDQTVLQYLGAAVVLQWDGLADDAKQAILQQADSVGGLTPVESLHDQINSLIQRTRG
jgi:hypothetical protein